MNKTIIKFHNLINHKIENINLNLEPREIYEPLKYMMSLKSKRFRPTLTMMSYNLFKDDLESIIKPAIAIEFFHNFTLIHDDIMDDAEIRRGNDTIHKKWNKNIGILSGDLLMIFSYYFKLFRIINVNIIFNR